MSKSRKHQSMAEQKLKREHPDIHADLLAGRIPSLKKALGRAGLATKPSPLEKLLKAWGRADGSERQRFLAQIGAVRTSAPHNAQSGDAVTQIDAMAAMETPLIANGRYLLPATVRRIERIMSVQRLTPRDIADQIGHPGESRALSLALARGAALRLLVIACLSDWLDEQERQPLA